MGRYYEESEKLELFLLLSPYETFQYMIRTETPPKNNLSSLFFHEISASTQTVSNYHQKSKSHTFWSIFTKKTNLNTFISWMHSQCNTLQINETSHERWPALQRMVMASSEQKAPGIDHQRNVFSSRCPHMLHAKYPVRHIHQMREQERPSKDLSAKCKQLAVTNSTFSGRLGG